MSSPTLSSDLLPPSDPTKSVLDSPAPSHATTSQTPDNPDHQILSPLRPLRKYTRHQLVALSASPLVMPPPNMPELKVWFGSENENAAKKDDPPTPNNARERRFRRDADDGDTTSRPSFRTTLSQPSQMGNFKHQSLRSSDRDRERDRDRDGEKERERDIREKEGHERLRHLSDKFDRDRLALPLSASRKERDAAPHLNASTTRTAPVLSSNAASRRADTREAAKKKVGEASEDWRRGAEPRSGREDRVENGRREERDRVRDSSRPKREGSVTRKERDEPREKTQRGDRDRDEQRRDKDREGEPDEDPRRWRDDGKRDERMASRRERGRDKPNVDHHWEGSADKRWAGVDDRGFKRPSARDRKPGSNADDVKDKDDRRDREREKEKEPAWMDNYIPSEATPGILGGQSSTGELDGIQAWKKGLKESKDKEVILSASAKDTTLEKPLMPSSSAEKPAMDEIALFKLLMRQEEEKKKTDIDDVIPKKENINNPSSKTEDALNLVPQRKQTVIEDPLTKLLLARKPEEVRSQPQSVSMDPPAPSMDLPPSFPPGMKDISVPGKSDTSQDRTFTQGSGLTNLGVSDLSQLPSSIHAAGDSGPVTNSFQPPPGSRLLALARPVMKVSNSTQSANNTLQGSNGGLSSGLPDAAQLYVKNESPRPPPGFSPFDDQSRQHFVYEESREINIPLSLNANSRIPLEQTFNPNPNAQIETNYNGVPAGKGSRFAKFFDGKARESVPPPGKHQIPAGFTSPSPSHNSRPEHASLIQANQGDQRAMDELFAMLNNSSQRGNMVPLSNQLINNNGAFGAPGPNLHTLQQQHLQQSSQQIHNNRLEPLYDSRSEDRSFVPDGMVPGLRPIPPPPPRGRDTHFTEHVDDSIHYAFQRMPPQHNQQPQIRSLEPLYPGPGPIFAQQGVRPHAGINLQNLQQQPHFRGGPSPNSNQGGPIPNGQQRLPPGLANLGGRPPHEPAQFMGMASLPSNLPHNPLHANSQLPPQQLPFNNNFNTGNNLGFNGIQVRGPVPGPHLHNSGAQQLSLGNNGLPNMDLRLSNHHQLMGLGGSGVSGNRVNGGFPQQGPAPPSHLAMRSQQQQQQQHPPSHMLPHLIPSHLQGHPNSNNQSHDLMALLMGGPQRE